MYNLSVQCELNNKRSKSIYTLNTITCKSQTDRLTIECTAIPIQNNSLKCAKNIYT